MPLSERLGIFKSKFSVFLTFTYTFNFNATGYLINLMNS